MNKKYVEEVHLSTRIEKEEEFFSKEYLLSYSALNKLLFSPAAFYKHYVLDQKEEKIESYLIQGKLIHCLLLTPALFESDFVIASDKTPSDSVVKVINKVYEIHKMSYDEEQKELHANLSLEDYSEQIISILEEINLYQSLIDDKKADKKGNQLTGDEKRLNKVITDEAIEYWEHLKSCEHKTMITYEQYEFAKLVVDKIKSTPNICSVMGIDKDNDNIKVENEVYLTAPYRKHFGLKGFIDNLVFDFENKVIRINDFKTTNKTLDTFGDSIEQYKYNLQLVVYLLLVGGNYLANEKFKDWKFECRFIVIDSFAQVGIFFVKEETLHLWLSEFESIISNVELYFKNKDFSVPYNFLNEKHEVHI